MIFAGDAAHQVSPFGARGANSGVQDADNLGWKLAAVIAGAPEELVATYDRERSEAADENILNSTRATDFIAPRGKAGLAFRDAALSLAPHADFAKRFVNSGRLSLPTSYADSPLSTRDGDDWESGPAPGAPVPDAPVSLDGRAGHLSEHWPQGFAVLRMDDGGAAEFPAAVTVLTIGEGEGMLRDDMGLVARRFSLKPGSAYLVRPDRHVAARFRAGDGINILMALAKAVGR